MKSVYRLEGDGTPQGTKVIDPDGNVLKGVRSARYEIGADSLGVLHLEVYGGVSVPATVVKLSRILVDTSELGDEYKSNAVVKKDA